MSRPLSVIFAVGLLAPSGGTSNPAPAQDTTATASASATPRLPEGWPFLLDEPAAVGEHGMVVTDQGLATRNGPIAATRKPRAPLARAPEPRR